MTVPAIVIVVVLLAGSGLLQPGQAAPVLAQVDTAGTVIHVSTPSPEDKRTGANSSASFAVFKTVIEDVASEEGWDLRFVPGDREENLSLHQRSVIWLHVLPRQDQPEGAELFYSQEAVLSTWGQVYAPRGGEISSLLDLSGNVVALLGRGHDLDHMQQLISQFNLDVDILVAKSYRDVLEAVELGFADLGVVDRAFGALHHAEYSNVVKTPVILSPEELRFAVTSRDHLPLLHTIDYYIALFKQDEASRYYAVLDEMFGTRAGFRLPRWLVVGLVTLLILLLISFLVVAILRRQVRHQTSRLRRSNEILEQEIRIRKRQEDKLRRLATIVEQMVEGVVTTTPDGTVDYVNSAFEGIWRQSADKVIGSPFSDLIQGPDRDLLITDVRESIRAGQQWRSRFRNVRPDGNEVDLEASVTPVRKEDGETVYVLCILRDVSHETQLEQRLRQSQKLEAIGTLAGGIAHDFNNALFSMMGFTDLALRMEVSADNRKMMLERVLEAGQRAKDLVSQILTFSRQNEREHQVIEIVPILKETLKLLIPSIDEGLEVKTDFPANRVLVRSDPTQLHQITMNLCKNAVHAMREVPAACLEVSLTRQAIDEIVAERHPDLRVGEYARLSVRDNGKGMEPEVLERIFEPFYTTKPSGEGTGMGLSVVHGIVRSHGGAIDVYSNPGKGTTFHVFLPLATGGGESAAPVPDANLGGSERVMIVDDEKNVAHMLGQMLTFLGYDATTFTSPHEAAKAFESDPDACDLILTDLSMPGMTGLQLADRCLAARSDIPIVLITGFGQGLTPEAVREKGIRELVHKPVLTRELAPILRVVLNSSPTPVQGDCLSNSVSN